MALLPTFCNNVIRIGTWPRPRCESNKLIAKEEISNCFPLLAIDFETDNYWKRNPLAALYPCNYSFIQHTFAGLREQFLALANDTIDLQIDTVPLKEIHSKHVTISQPVEYRDLTIIISPLSFVETPLERALLLLCDNRTYHNITIA